ISGMVREAVATHLCHPAIFGYLVGNEISSTMVRWLGVRRVTEFVEHLIRIGRETDPNVLFSYASYPPTEFLLPQNSDFSCFNVYLHNQDAFERYLLRSQNLSEDRPPLLSELGQDNADLPHRPLPSYPFVSIIVCSYNGAKTLAACLESLGRIDYPNYEVILVDDGSTDNTREIAARFANVRYLHQTNHGLSHARNHGASIAKGEIFAYTDSD